MTSDAECALYDDSSESREENSTAIHLHHHLPATVRALPSWHQRSYRPFFNSHQGSYILESVRVRSGCIQRLNEIGE